MSRINSTGKGLMLFGVMVMGDFVLFQYLGVNLRILVALNLVIFFVFLISTLTKPQKKEEEKKPQCPGFNQINLQLEAKNSECQPPKPPTPPPHPTCVPIVFKFLAYVTVIVSISGGGVYVGRYWFKSVSNEKIESAVAEVNGRAIYWKIEPSNISIKADSIFDTMRLQANMVSQGCAEKPRAQYMLTIRDIFKETVYLFDDTEYTLNIDEELTRFTTAGVCNYNKRWYDGKKIIRRPFRDPYLDDYDYWGEYHPYHLDTVKLPVGRVAVELVYTLMKVIQASGSCAEVLVRGYADGQNMKWQKALHGKYNYQKIPVYHPYVPVSEHAFQYSATKEDYPVPKFYKNGHLPNLRAMFVKENIIIPTLSACNAMNKVQVSILDGHDFIRLNPLERKVHVYLIVY
jgi:hypothetical protein